MVFIFSRKLSQENKKHNKMQPESTFYLLRVLLRLHSNLVEQDVPVWLGFVSLIGERPEKKATIDYYPVIFNPITEHKTVQECSSRQSALHMKLDKSISSLLLIWVSA